MTLLLVALPTLMEENPSGLVLYTCGGNHFCGTVKSHKICSVLGVLYNASDCVVPKAMIVGCCLEDVES